MSKIIQISGVAGGFYALYDNGEVYEYNDSYITGGLNTEVEWSQEAYKKIELTK